MNKLYLIWNKNKLVIEDGDYYLDRFKLYNVNLINLTLPELGIIKIQKRKKEIILISDTINSIELYITFFKNKITLSDTPIIKDLDKNNLEEFQKLGYCINEKTIYKDTILLTCSSKMILNINENKKYKYKYLNNFNNFDYDFNKTLNNLNNLISNKVKVFNKYDKVILFLSAGYDSRLILNLIATQNLKNFYLCVFGSIYSEETKFALSYAKQTKLPIIDLSHRFFIKNIIEKRIVLNNFLKNHSFTYTPNLDFFSACFDIKKKYPNEKIICLNGNSGDFTDGRQEMDNFKKFDQKFSFYNYKLAKKLDLNKIDIKKNIQEYNHQNRQGKYTISPRLTYEFYNFDHWHILWEQKYLETIFSGNNFDKRRSITEECLKNTNIFNFDIYRNSNKPYLKPLKYIFYLNRLISKYILNDRCNYIFYFSNYTHIYQLFNFLDFFKVITIKKINSQSKGGVILIHKLIKKILII